MGNKVFIAKVIFFEHALYGANRIPLGSNIRSKDTDAQLSGS
jgi:hypothetical protein